MIWKDNNLKLIMNRITPVTRKDIFDYVRVEAIWWSGRLQEEDFLSRVFDLTTIASSDGRFDSFSGDLWQHRVNNHDWEDDWIFEDTRFDLLNCDDSIFLNFLCEMIHPIVRSNLTEVNHLLQIFNEYLKNDNFEIVEKSKISNKPIFTGRLKASGHEIRVKKNLEITAKLSNEYVTQQINLMESSIENSPYVAIGIAKELIETCCKTIIFEKGGIYDEAWDLAKLVKKTNELLKLTPKDIPDEQKASKTIKSILGSLTTVVHGICELRNSYGSGHGKDTKFKGLELQQH